MATDATGSIGRIDATAYPILDGKYNWEDMSTSPPCVQTNGSNAQL